MDENVVVGTFSSGFEAVSVVVVKVITAVVDVAVVVVISNFSVLSLVDGLFFFFVPLCL